MIPEAERTPQPGVEQPNAFTPSQQMAGQTPLQPQSPGYPPAFAGVSGAAWVFRDFASFRELVIFGNRVRGWNRPVEIRRGHSCFRTAPIEGGREATSLTTVRREASGSQFYTLLTCSQA